MVTLTQAKWIRGVSLFLSMTFCYCFFYLASRSGALSATQCMALTGIANLAALLVFLVEFAEKEQVRSGLNRALLRILNSTPRTIVLCGVLCLGGCIAAYMDWSMKWKTVACDPVSMSVLVPSAHRSLQCNAGAWVRDDDELTLLAEGYKTKAGLKVSDVKDGDKLVLVLDKTPPSAPFRCTTATVEDLVTSSPAEECADLDPYQKWTATTWPLKIFGAASLVDSIVHVGPARGVHPREFSVSILALNEDCILPLHENGPEVKDHVTLRGQCSSTVEDEFTAVNFEVTVCQHSEKVAGIDGAIAVALESSDGGYLEFKSCQ